MSAPQYPAVTKRDHAPANEEAEGHRVIPMIALHTVSMNIHQRLHEKIVTVMARRRIICISMFSGSAFVVV